MKKLFTTFVVVSLFVSQSFAVTNIFVQNNTALAFQVSSTQTGSHKMESNEWWGYNGSIIPWQKNSKLLWTNRDQGIHNGTNFYLTVALTANGQTVQCQLKLYGQFVGSKMWVSSAGPGFNHAWFYDRNFHSQNFTISGKSYTLKYQSFYTGGNDDVLYTIHENTEFVPTPSTDNSVNILAYNVQFLPIVGKDMTTRAGLIPSNVPTHDIAIYSEVFENGVRENTFRPALRNAGYKHQTPVLDNPAYILEDGGVVIASKYPIEAVKMYTYTVGADFDAVTPKGVLYAKINKNGRRFHVFGSHTQAYKEYYSMRQQQLREMKNWITSLNIPSNEPVIIGGDLNVDKVDNYYNEYNDMFPILNTSIPTYEGNYQYSFDPYTNYYITDEAEYLDYVLVSNSHRVATSNKNRVIHPKTIADSHWGKFDLSDHYGIYSQITFPTLPFSREYVENNIESGYKVEYYNENGLVDIKLPELTVQNDKVTFALTKESSVKVLVHDLAGKEIFAYSNANLTTGIHEIPVTGIEPNTIYVYELIVNGVKADAKKSVKK